MTRGAKLRLIVSLGSGTGLGYLLGSGFVVAPDVAEVFSPKVPIAFAAGIGAIAFMYWRHLEQKVQEFDSMAPLSDTAFMLCGWLLLIIFQPGFLDPYILPTTVVLLLLCLARPVSMKIEIQRTQPLVVYCDIPEKWS